MSKSRARDLADIADKNMSGTMSVDALDISGNIAVVGTVDGRDIATDGTKLDGVEASATADQTKADIEGLGIDLPAANLTGTIDAARLSTATTQAESDDSTKIATTAYVVDKITTLIGGAPSTLNDLNELAAAINDDASYNSTLTTALGTKLPKAGGTMTGDLTVPNVIVSGNVDGRDVSVDGTKLDGIEAGATNYTHPTNHAISVITGLQTALDGKVDDAQVLTNVPANAVFTDTNTTYSVGDGGLTQINFTSADNTKLDGIATGATNTVGNATHTGEVTGSGALTIANDVVDAGNLKVTGNGTTSQYLRSDADGTFTWATPPDTNTTYSVGDGGLSQINFTSADHTKLNGIATGATDNTVANAALPKAGGTMSGAITTPSDIISTGRDNGVFGSYNSNYTDQIWSMGTSYRNHASGTNFGNLYGFAYKHTNNTTGGTMASGHMAVWCQNGSPYVALGTNIWTSGSVIVGGTVDGRDVAADGTKLDGIAASANNYSFPYTVSASNSNNTVVQRGSSGYIFANYFNTTANDVTSGVTKVMVETGNDNYIRHGDAGSIRTFLGIEAGATADQSAAEIQTAMAPVVYNNSTVAGLKHSNGEKIIDANINSYTYLYYNNSWQERMHNGYCEASSSYRTHTFYDIDNTTYYTNPAATSVMNDIQMEGEIIHKGDTNTYLQFHSADQWRVVTGGGERLEVNNTNTTVANNLIVSGSATFNGAVTGAGGGLAVRTFGYLRNSGSQYVTLTMTNVNTSNIIIIENLNDVTFQTSGSSGFTTGYSYNVLTTPTITTANTFNLNTINGPGAVTMGNGGRYGTVYLIPTSTTVVYRYYTLNTRTQYNVRVWN